MNIQITQDEVATYRPDGARNIFRATVYDPKIQNRNDVLALGDWNGPMWNGVENRVFWQVDSSWSNREVPQNIRYSEDACRILSLFAREQEDRLSKEEYAWLAEKGYIKTCGDYNGMFKSAWQVVILNDAEIQQKLLEIGGKIKGKYQDAFSALKKPYVKAILETVPKHLQRVKEYELQFLFHDDARFLLHCMIELLKSGKLKEPTEGQKKSLSTLIAYT